MLVHPESCCLGAERGLRLGTERGIRFQGISLIFHQTQSMPRRWLPKEHASRSCLVLSAANTHRCDRNRNQASSAYSPQAAASPTTGWLRWVAPIDPWNPASPKAKMPPSDATSQYPLPSGVDPDVPSSGTGEA